MAAAVEVCGAVVFVLAAGFGGVVRCEIGVLLVDLAVEASLDVDFCELFTNVEYFTIVITNQSGSVPLNLGQKNNETVSATALSSNRDGAVGKSSKQVKLSRASKK